MNKAGKCLSLAAAFAAAVLPLLSQTAPKAKPVFEVVSIKPSAPGPGLRGGGARGDRYMMSGATLRLLLQNAYQKPSNAGPAGQVEIVGGPSWIDSDRYDVQATADCSGGTLTREQLQLMIQSMLEDRFQLKAHTETRELPIYNLVAAKDGVKLKLSVDQTAPALNPGGGPPLPCTAASATPPPPVPSPPPRGADGRGGLMDPSFAMPRGVMGIMFGPTGFGIRAAAVQISALAGTLQQMVGRPVYDKTNLTTRYDFTLQFSGEGLNVPGLPPGAAPGAGPAGAAAAADPIPSIFTALQDAGLRLESSKGPVEVLVVDSAQKPTEN